VDLNSGLVYYGYRFYDPNLQRWINRDPIGEKGALNLYLFAMNDPQLFIDTYGFTCWTRVLQGIGSVALAGVTIAAIGVGAVVSAPIVVVAGIAAATAIALGATQIAAGFDNNNTSIPSGIGGLTSSMMTPSNADPDTTQYNQQLGDNIDAMVGLLTPTTASGLVGAANQIYQNLNSQ
jgi:uncharacterized protein RhaS with RHS repeats